MALLAGLLLAGIFTANGEEKPDSASQSELFHGSHLPTDREASRRLVVAQELIAARRYSDAVRLLDQILAAEEDHFGAKGDSLKRSALERLLELPSGGRRTYALLLQSQLDRDIAAAQTTQEVGADLAALAARFPPELLGAPAWRAWAATASEQGHYAHAAQLLRTIVSVSKGEQASLANDSHALAIQLARMSQREAAVQTLEVVRNEKPDETVAQLLRATRSAQQQWSATRSPEAWLGAEGDAGRNSQAPGDAPLAWRQWRAPLFTEASEASRLAKLSEAVALAPRLAAQNIVAVDGKLFATTVDHLIAIDAESGKRLWMAPRQSSASSVRDGMGLNEQQDAAILAPVVERTWLDRVHGGISSDSQRLFSVSESASVVPLEGNRTRSRAFRGQGLPLANGLQAYDIATQGKRAWTLDGGDLEGPVAGAFFFGPPLAHEGRLMALAQIDQTICFLLIDAETGQVQWRQSLVALERGVESNERLRLIGTVPTVSGDLVICPTGAGVVVAVDPNRRRLVWAHRFPIETERLRDVRRRDLQRFFANFDASWRQKPSWRETHTITSGERLLVVSPESDRLHCLDRETGNAIWEKLISKGLAIGAVTSLPQGEAAIVIEASAISARSVSTGKQLWRISTPAGDPPAGAGLLVDNRFLLPLLSGRLAAVSLAEEKPTLELTDLGINPFDTASEGGALAYHRNAIYVRTGSALARYDQQPPDKEPSRSELSARLAASLARQAQANLSLVPSATEQLAELVTDRAGRRLIVILQIEAAIEREDLAGAVEAAYQLAGLQPHDAVIEGLSGERMAADRWTASQIARLWKRAGKDSRQQAEQQLQDYWNNKTDLSTAEALIGIFHFLPDFSSQMAVKLHAEQQHALEDRLALLIPEEPQRSSGETPDLWATHQATATLNVLETPVEITRRSPVFRHRQTPKSDQRLSLRQGGPNYEVPHEWRLVGQQSEARDLIGTNDVGERIASLRLPDSMEASQLKQGVGRPRHWQPGPWQWGPYLILSIEGQVNVYDVRPGIDPEERLRWTTASSRSVPPQTIRLEENRGARQTFAGEGPAQILWASPKGVVMQRGKQLTCHDLLTGRLLWQRRFQKIEQILGNDEQLYVATSNRSGKVLSLLDGTTLSRWRPPRGDWQIAQGVRLLVTNENEIRAYDLSVDAMSPVRSQELAPNSLFTRIDDHRFATLDPNGELTLFDLQFGKSGESVRFKTRVEKITKPKSLHIYGLGKRLLVLVNEVGAEKHRTLGRSSLSAEPLVTGKMYGLDRLTGAPLWQSPASLEGESLLPAPIAGSPVAFFGSQQTIPGVSDRAATQNRLVVIDMASGRTIYRNDSLPASGAQAGRFWVQREKTPSDRLLVSLGTARIRLDSTFSPSPPSPPYHAMVERRDASGGNDLSGIGRNLGRLLQSMIAPETAEEKE